MEAPDKIYLAFKDGFVAQAANHKEAILKEYVPLTYICKDTLTEWLNKKLQESVDRLDFRANQAYAELINKLNSL